MTGVWTEQSKRGTEQTVTGKICSCFRKKKKKVAFDGYSHKSGEYSQACLHSEEIDSNIFRFR